MSLQNGSPIDTGFNAHRYVTKERDVFGRYTQQKTDFPFQKSSLLIASRRNKIFDVRRETNVQLSRNILPSVVHYLGSIYGEARGQRSFDISAKSLTE